MKKLLYSLCIGTILSTMTYAQENKENGKEKKEIDQEATSPVQLPPAVQASVERELPGFLIKTTRKFETSDINGVPYYEVEAERGKESYNLQIAEDGKVLKKTALKAEVTQPKKEF